MKIAIHQPRGSYFLGGAESISIELAKYLSENNIITFITSKNNLTKNFKEFMKENENIRFIFIESPTIHEFKSYQGIDSGDIESLIFNEAANEIYRKENFDIIIAHYSTDILNIHKGTAKIILHLHGYPRKYKEIDNISYNKADALICCSEHVVKKTKEFFPYLKRMYKFYHIPDLKKFKENNQQKVNDVLYVGRLTPRKGVSILINALNKINKNFKNCIIAGEGSEKDNLKKQVKQLGLNKKVKLIGSVEKEEVIKLMASSKIFVHPTNDREPYPTTLMEAMAIGTTIISTKIGGIPEIIESGKDGLLVNPNEDELGDAIKFLLGNTSERDRFVRNGLKKINIKFDFNKKKKEYQELIREIYKNAHN